MFSYPGLSSHALETGMPPEQFDELLDVSAGALEPVNHHLWMLCDRKKLERQVAVQTNAQTLKFPLVADKDMVFWQQALRMLLVTTHALDVLRADEGALVEFAHNSYVRAKEQVDIRTHLLPGAVTEPPRAPAPHVSLADVDAAISRLHPVTDIQHDVWERAANARSHLARGQWDAIFATQTIGEVNEAVASGTVDDDLFVYRAAENIYRMHPTSALDFLARIAYGYQQRVLQDEDYDTGLWVAQRELVWRQATGVHIDEAHKRVQWWRSHVDGVTPMP